MLGKKIEDGDLFLASILGHSSHFMGKKFRACCLLLSPKFPASPHQFQHHP